MHRRAFLQTVLGGSAAGSVLVVAACGDDGGSAPIDAPIDAPPSCTANGADSVIVANHGHAMMVTAAEIDSPMDREYDITGGADHTHTAMVASAQFETLATNAPVMVTSSLGQGHTHTITIRCR